MSACQSDYTISWFERFRQGSPTPGVRGGCAMFPQFFQPICFWRRSHLMQQPFDSAAIVTMFQRAHPDRDQLTHRELMHPTVWRVRQQLEQIESII